MKIKILKPCVDKVTKEAYKVGQVYEVDDERGAQIITAKGGTFAEQVREPKKKAPAKKAETKAQDEKPARKKAPAKKKTTPKSKAKQAK